ncbi:uncharacterized protein YgiM (DUF1202 family) [Streptosporangium lutulentum]|uniref:Uncharacterized protein YgiM (DUF1202 family) n=1 Tax=Streptosporangium lutulentum TaxID=1461250 RepID=A0ABT9Q731_9ACTN|nr:SH3 domain-containing protein [Streptosporangium lutulentum]MDP9842560.1 uncharacterized protein YgiM (DUF1202 family) [Streptosporangium lutulentum]
MSFGTPAKAAPQPLPSGTESRPALTCSYRVAHVRANSFLNVRSSAALRSHRVGKLKVSDGRFAGACRPTNGWVAVNSSRGKPGWASGEYLRKTKDAPSSGTESRPALSCTYRVAHMRANGFLNVRSSAARHSSLVGKLKVSDGRFAGACQPTNGWVAVNSSQGKPGWASAKYLRKVTGK